MVALLIRCREWRTLLLTWASSCTAVSAISMAVDGLSFTKMSSSGSMIGVDICVGCRKVEESNEKTDQLNRREGSVSVNKVLGICSMKEDSIIN